MTADELHRVIIAVADIFYVKFWIHWNDRDDRPSDRWVMGVRIRDHEGIVRFEELDAIGFAWDDVDRIHLIDRTNADGTPFRSNVRTP